MWRGSGDRLGRTERASDLAVQRRQLVAKDGDLEASVGVVLCFPSGSRLQAGERPQLLRSRTLIWTPTSTRLAAPLAGIRS
jgi:hypothetical protein